MKGKLVILSGPSGVGKDTVINAWHAQDPRVVRVVAYTTRPPREGERDGVDYHFVSRETFDRMAARGDFLEYKKVYENFYATPLKDMEALLASGQIAVLKIDVQGALSAMKLRPDAITVFLIPPSMDELEHRIRNRASDSDQSIAMRLDKAREEMEHAGNYQHQIVNDELPGVITQLQEIVA